MNVLFVSKTRFIHAPYRDGSIRYRCYHMAEALQAAGFLADVVALDQIDLINLSRYDVVSVHRPSASRHLLRLLEACDRLGIKTVADVDSLEFEPTLASESAKSHLRNSSVATVRASFMRHKLALQHFDEISVATDRLAKTRRAQMPSQPVYTAYNGLSNYWLSRNDQIQTKRSSKKRISYISGSRGVENDFLVAAKPIDQFLKKTENSEFHVIGAIDLSDESIEPSKLVRGAWTDFMNMPNKLASSWICVAPLNNTRINEAKPHTNFIESAAFGVPIICSPTEDLKRHDVPGLHLVEDENQWQQALEQLSDKHYYETCQKALYEYARDTCLATQSANVLIERWTANIERIEDETLTSLSAAS